MRVGIAEDVSLLREGISAILAGAGHEILWAVSDADQLRARFSEAASAAAEPDVVVIDVRMPPGNMDDGLRAAVEIRAAHPGVGILVLS